MDRGEVEKIIADHESLLDLALSILSADGPPWGFVFEKRWARLSFDGDEAVVSHPEAECEWDSAYLDTNEHRFPASLLWMTADELAAWKADATQQYEAEKAEKRRFAALELEANERAALELLKAKYESRKP